MTLNDIKSINVRRKNTKDDIYQGWTGKLFFSRGGAGWGTHPTPHCGEGGVPNPAPPREKNSFLVRPCSTALSTNFGQPETGPACRFRFCFLDIWKRTIQLKMRVRTTASQDIFVGFNPLTIISGQSYISELIAQHSHFSDDRSSPSSQKMNGECSFLKATQCSEGPVFSTPNQYTKCDIRLWYWRKVPERKNQKEIYKNWKVKVWM